MNCTNGGINKIRLDELIKTNCKYKESKQLNNYTEGGRTQFYLRHDQVMYQAKEDYTIGDCSLCLNNCDHFYLVNKFEQNKILSCFEYYELVEITDQRLILELLVNQNYYEVTQDLTK